MDGGESRKGTIFVEVDDDEAGCRIHRSLGVNTVRSLQIWEWRF